VGKPDAERMSDPLEGLKNPLFVAAFCLFWVLTALLPSSGIAMAPQAGGAGGADRIGSTVPGMAEEEGEPPADEGLVYEAYAIQKGDQLARIAEGRGITLDTIYSFNNIKNARGIRIGQLIKIPNMSGILHTAKEGDDVASVATAYGVSADRIIEANGLFTVTLAAGSKVFVPDARLSSFALKEISGDLFRWPVGGWITSYYGWRNDPFTGDRRFHNGLDIGSAYGTPVGAAVDGNVVGTGYSPVLGNFISISHYSGYQTLYAHLSRIVVKSGQRVAQGQLIGNVGTSGYSTGSHLHFSVYKWGRPMNPANVLY
jgi:murein DD-endopeptidase MepM/ murein hydrolase activator NlpD